MVNIWWVQVLTGSVLGLLSGLGIGGGSLLMLWLTQLAGVAPDKARLMNLMFFLPCALTATLLRRGHEKPAKKLLLTAIAGGLAGAMTGHLFRGILPPELAQKALGGLFLTCGIRELCYRERKFR